MIQTSGQKKPACVRCAALRFTPFPQIRDPASRKTIQTSAQKKPTCMRCALLLFHKYVAHQGAFKFLKGLFFTKK